MVKRESGAWQVMRAYLPAFVGPLLAIGFAASGLASIAEPIAPHPLTRAQARTLQRPATPPAKPPAPPPELQAEVEDLAARYREPVGIAIVDVESGWTAQVGDGLFPQQSVSKLWVALSIFDAVDRGALRLDQPVTLYESDRSVFYQPIARHLDDDGFTTPLLDLLRRALVESDNAANDRLIRVLGGVETVDAVLAAKGIDAIRIGAPERDLQTRIAGLPRWLPEYGHGMAFKLARAALPDVVREQAEDAYLADPPDGASPAAIALALARLHKGELLSPASTAVFLQLMTEARTGPRRLKAGLPPGWTLAHKTGTGPDGKRGSVGINDVGLATSPDGRTYAVAVMMRRTRNPIGARMAFMQSVSRALSQWDRGAG